jgi:hypothetical protein
MFRMNLTPAPSPSRPGTGPAPAASDASGGGGLLAQVLRALVGISVRLGMAAHRAATRATGAGEAPPVDLPRVWALLMRAEQWIAALRARLDSGAAGSAAKDSRAEWDLELDGSELRLEFDRPDTDPLPRSRHGGKAPRDPIAGLTDLAVVEQICTDLAAAARLLGETDLAETAAAIAQAVQRRQAHPIPTRRGGMPPPAAHPPRAPDTG